VGNNTAAKRLAVVATQREKRARIAGREFLDFGPCPPQILERLGVAGQILVLQLLERSPYPRRWRYLHLACLPFNMNISGPAIQPIATILAENTVENSPSG
jgi:hypothetical protein